MGSSFTAPLASVGGGHRDLIHEALGISPDLIPHQLKPLLDMDIHGLCEAYKRLAERCAEHDSGASNTGNSTAASVASCDLEGLLGLPTPGARLIVARRAAVPVVELLLLLVLLSNTHALVKPRFIFCVCQNAWNGDLNFETFRAIVAALLRGVFFLSQKPRAEFPKLSSADVLARPLFAPYSPRMNKDAFLWLASSEGPVWALLRRFARGALDQYFLLTPWPVQADSPESQSPSQAWSPMDSAEDSSKQDLPTKPRQSVLPKRREARTPGKGPAPPSSLYMVPPRRRPQTARPTPSKISSSLARCRSPSPKTSSQRSSKLSQASISKPFAVPKPASPNPLPRRKGYFQAVPSRRERELVEELQQLQCQKAHVLKQHGIEKQLAEKQLADYEEDLRGKILQEVKDKTLRKDYRKQIAQIRKGEVTLPSTPVARLWTASREHAIRGGELPYQCPEPLTPGKLQLMLLRSIEAKERKQAVEVEVKKSGRGLEDALQLASALPPSVTRRLTGVVGKSQVSDVESSDDASESSKQSPSSASSKSKLCPASTNVARRKDVLLAFELYRNSYWDDSAALAKAKEKKESATMSCRRDIDIDAILQESDKDYFSSHQTECKSSGYTLRKYLKTVFGANTQGDLKQMINWIEDSRTNNGDENHTRVESQRRLVAALRELIDLFDTIDKDSSGAVPLSAIEQFLCGELLTDRELFQSKNNDRASENVYSSSVATYVDSIKELSRARFLSRLVDDREEWSVLVPDHERRWAGLQQRFSMKEYKSMDHGQQSRNKQVQMTKVIGIRMEKLAKFLDEERGACAYANDAEGNDGDQIERIHGRDLDFACTPHFNVGHIPSETAGGDGKQIRLVRLYWRYLLGSAVQQSLRDYDQHFNLRSDGRVDLVAFVCILAHDQVLRLLPKGEKPTPQSLRKIVYS